MKQMADDQISQIYDMVTQLVRISGSHTAAIEELRSSVEGLRSGFDGLSTNYERLNSTVEGLNSTVEGLSSTVNGLATSQQRFEKNQGILLENQKHLLRNQETLEEELNEFKQKTRGRINNFDEKMDYVLLKLTQNEVKLLARKSHLNNISVF